MKIGDGGLQGMVTHDDVTSRQARERQIQKPDGTEEAVKQQEAGTQLSINALNKAVEKLNENAKSHNLPVEFSVKKDEEELLIQLRNTDSGKQREVSTEELPRLLRGMEENRGLIIDEYF